MFLRPLVKEGDGGLSRAMRNGDGLENPILTANTTDSNQTITIAAIMGGVYQRNGISADRVDTTPTAVAILAANPAMDIGDCLRFIVSNIDTTNKVTLAGGVGVTASGSLDVLLSTSRTFMLRKTAAATMDLIGL